MEIFLYQGVLLFEQFHISTEKLSDPKYPLFITNLKQWMIMEVAFYYLQIFNTGIFLLMIQIRGTLGKKDLEANKLRYKQDAIEYYELDIDWFSFQFVLFTVHSMMFFGRLLFLNQGMTTEQQILLVLIVQRVVQFFLIRRLRD